MTEQLLDEGELYPFVEGKNVSFKCPAPTTFDKYVEHIEISISGETTLAYGLHPNAEIGFRTDQCNVIFTQLLDIMPKDVGGDDEDDEGGACMGPYGKAEEEAIRILEELGTDDEKYPGRRFDLMEINNRIADEKTPFQNVFMQECE